MAALLFAIASSSMPADIPRSLAGARNSDPWSSRRLEHSGFEEQALAAAGETTVGGPLTKEGPAGLAGLVVGARIAGPMRAADARRYAADLEEGRSTPDIDFVEGFYEPRKPEELTALSRLMNLPADVVSELLCDFEKLDPSRDWEAYRMTRTALQMNHRLVDYPEVLKLYEKLKDRDEAKSRDLIKVLRHMQYFALLQKGGDGKYDTVNRRVYEERYVGLWKSTAWQSTVEKMLRRCQNQSEIHIQAWAISDGGALLTFIQHLQARLRALFKGKAPEIIIDACDIMNEFSIVEGLFPEGHEDHHLEGYTFIFKPDGQVIQAYGPQGEVWMRWLVSEYFKREPERKKFIEGIIDREAGITFGEQAMPVEIIEKQWKAVRDLRASGDAPSRLNVHPPVRLVLPAVDAYADEGGKNDPQLHIYQADIFTLPQETPAKYYDLILVEGLLHRTGDYQSAETIQSTIGQLGRTLKDGGWIVNAIRGSFRFDAYKPYVDFIVRIGNMLRRKRMLGYDRPERQELWWRDPEYSNDNFRKYAVAGETDPQPPQKHRRRRRGRHAQRLILIRLRGFGGPAFKSQV